ncbi:MAG: hypothetical protein ACSHWN_04625 [Methylophilaceae bacterium]
MNVNNELPVRTGKYRPSNGTEGDIFYAGWCARCINDNPQDFDLCPILGNTMCYDLDDDEYPNEWVWEDSRPICTAFVAVDGLVKERCAFTADMFDVNGGVR